MKRFGQQHDPFIPLVIGTQTAATNQFTGALPLDELKHGQSIRYWLPHAGKSSGNTLNLSLRNGTTTGEKQLYYKGSTKLTTQFSAGSLILLTYLENANVNGVTYTGWWTAGAVQPASGGTSSADHTHTWEDVATAEVLEDLVITSDDVNYGGYHKVSDEAPTLEQIQKGGTVSFNEGGNGIVTMNYPEGDITVMTMGMTNGAAIVFNGLALAAVAFEDGAKVLGNTLDEKGIYFVQDDYVITHSLTISEYATATEVVPIPYEFLPEPLQFGQTSYSVETLVDNQTIPMSGGEGTEPLACEIVAGNTYDLTWNGVEYKGLVAKEISAEGMSIVFIGNAGPMGMGEDTGEPFVVAYIVGMGTMVMEYSGELTECTVTLKELVTETKQFDIKYLPESHQFYEKTIYTDTITWDGDTGKVECLDPLGSGQMLLCHVSSATPTLNDFANGGKIKFSDYTEMEFTSDEILPIGNDVLAENNFNFIVAPNDNITVTVPYSGINITVTFPKKGIYFGMVVGSGYTQALTINGYNGFETTEIKKLEGKYLEPFDYVAGSDTVSVDVDGVAYLSISKITDEVLAIADFANATVVIENANGTQTIKFNSDEAMSQDGMTIAQVSFRVGNTNNETGLVFISTALANAELGIEIPSPGTYTMGFGTDTTVTKISLTIPGKEMGGSLKLKPECLPGQQEDYIKTTILPDDWGSGFIRVNETVTASDRAFGVSLYNAASKGGFKISGWAYRTVDGTREQIGRVVIDFTPAYTDENGAYIATGIVGLGGVLYGLYATITETNTTFILNELALATS